MRSIYLIKFIIILVLFFSINLEISARASKSWKEYADSTWIAHSGNDGDSFHVDVGRRHYIFRLYFIDTLESSLQIPDRVKEQATEFGISKQQAIQYGKKATKFTEKLLKNKSFTVYSKRLDARGASAKKRFYGMVNIEGEWLSELLVKNGLARIYGYDNVDLPDGTKNTTYRFRLKTAQREAKEKKLGIWGAQEPDAKQAQYLALTKAPEISEQTVALIKTVYVYSLKNASHYLGKLKPGTSVKVLRAQSSTMARIRFMGGSNKVYEAQCRITDLPLEPDP